MQKTTFSDYPAVLAELDAREVSEVSGGGWLSTAFRVVSYATTAVEILNALKELCRKYCPGNSS